MISMTHERPQVTPVEPDRSERAVPSQGIERIKRISDYAYGTATLDENPPEALCLLRAEGIVDLR
jgi:hypothetical protein